MPLRQFKRRHVVSAVLLALGFVNPAFLALAPHDDYIEDGEPILGTGSKTFTRATTAMVRDHEGIYRTVLSGEQRFEGYRRVENMAKGNSKTLSGATTYLATRTTGISDPDGGTDAVTMTANGANAQFHSMGGVATVAGGTYLVSCWIRRRTGTGVVRFQISSGWSTSSVTAAVTSSWQRVVSAPLSHHASGTATDFRIQLDDSGDEVDLYKFQVENVSGKSDTTIPGEYVDVPSGNGAAKYFETTNGNSVASNVVTEADGDRLRPTVTITGSNKKRFKTYESLARSTALTALSHYVPDASIDGRRYYQCTECKDTLTGFSNGNKWSTPTGWTRFSTDFTIVLKVNDSTLGTHVYASSRDAVNSEWAVLLVSNNLHTVVHDGVAAYGFTSSVALTTVVNSGETVWIKFEFDADDGAGNKTAKFYTCFDYDPATKTGTWTQLGATITSGVTLSSFNNGGQALSIGHDSWTGGTWTGRIGYIAGWSDLTQTTLAWECDPDGHAGETSFAHEGNTWSRSGTAACAAGTTAAAAPSSLTDGSYTLGETILDGEAVLVDKGHYTLKGYLAEPQRTNSLKQSRDLNTTWSKSNTPTATYDEVGIDGAANSAATTEDDNGAGHEGFFQDITVSDDSNTHVMAVMVKDDGDETSFPSIHMSLSAGTAKTTEVHINKATGATTEVTSSVAAAFGTVEKYVGSTRWWLFWVALANNGTGNTNLRARWRPASGTVFGTADAAATGTAVVDAFQVELNESFPSSPIFTTTAAVQRNVDNYDLPTALVADAAGTLLCDSRWHSAPTSQHSFLGGAAGYLYYSSANKFSHYDSTDSATLTFTPVQDEDLRLATRWADGGNKQVAGNGNVSTEVAYDGTLWHQDGAGSVMTGGNNQGIMTMVNIVSWGSDKGEAFITTETGYDT